jgi:hypothetical protein
MQLSWFARGAASAERARRLMQLRGVTPNGHRLWNSLEAGDLTRIHPFYDRFLAKHSRRTRPAAHSKASRLQITKPRGRQWDVNEILRLRIYRTATKEEILAAFPGRSWAAIGTAARARGHRRPQRLNEPTGILIIDQILERAKICKLSLKDLDSIARLKGYFSQRKWRHKQNHVVHERLVAALGGTLRARFVAAR